MAQPDVSDHVISFNPYAHHQTASNSSSASDGIGAGTAGEAGNPFLIKFVPLATAVGSLAILACVGALFVQVLGCWRAARERRRLTDASHALSAQRAAEAGIAGEAGLEGMTSEERRRVLEEILVVETYRSRSRPPESADAEADGDAENPAPTTPDDNDAGQCSSECAICLNDYAPGDDIASGTQCSHSFHKECLLSWLDKHDVCPYCREPVTTSSKMRDAARLILGKERVAELGRRARSEQREAEAENAAPAVVAAVTRATEHSATSEGTNNNAEGAAGGADASASVEVLDEDGFVMDDDGEQGSRRETPPSVEQAVTALPN